MSTRRVVRRSLGPVLLVLALLVTAQAPAVVAQPERSRNYIVTLDVPDAGKAIRPVGSRARQRIRQRAQRASDVTQRLVRELSIRPGYRYTSAVAGFSARLTAREAARLRADRQVATVRPARRFRIASQVVPRGIRRVQAGPQGGPGPDVDADIAILDTGVGPVGGGELNVQGGINCSGDGRSSSSWQDLYPGRHGTHVAGTAAARDNGIGTVGVAPGARIWSVRVFDSWGYGDDSTIICGLDWAVSTRGPAPPAGSQPIDVINMSIQGPRSRGGPEACVGEGDPDPLHQAVCAAFGSGITMVAAAGNESTNTASVAPAGYDQVITVGAISDFDGEGGSKRPSTCRFYSREVDDAYASYSNYGADVDILAPGTCVVSTYPSASGAATAVLTGTSMSAPHVAGAVARYLARNPGTNPTQMRRIVRAAGRLDWLLKSDPRWSGVSDPDEPNRVLDVAALLDGPGLVTWLFPDRFKVGGRDRRRRLRVDVQRLGGYEGDVRLDLAGLPDAMGASSFDRPGTSLSGLAGLGARLTLSLKPNGPDGEPDTRVTAQGAGGGPVGSRRLGLLIDRTGPTVAGLAGRIRGGRTGLGSDGQVKAFLQWEASDDLGRVSRNQLQRRIGSGRWRSIAQGTRERASTTLRSGKRYRFRVRAWDNLGNRSSSSVLPVRLTTRDSSSSQWVAGDGWTSRTRKAALGGSLLVGDRRGPRLATQFEGVGVAVVAPVGPGRGRLRVRIDGGSWRVLDLRAGRNRDRRVVFSRQLAPGSHLLEIEVYRGTAAVDAVLILR